MNRSALLATFILLIALVPVRAGDDVESGFAPWRRPLSKVDALNLALSHNGTILQAQQDVRAEAGVAIQTRAILFPHVTLNAIYTVEQDSLIEANQDRGIAPMEVTLPGLGALELGGSTTPLVNNQSWAAEIQIVQSLYEGGRLCSAIRTSHLINEQAVLVYQSTVDDTLLAVSNAYDTVLGTAKQVEVQEAAVKFLSAYLDQTKIKLHAGAVPEFDVIRQDVETANAEAQRELANGTYLVAKQQLVELMGFNLPVSTSDDIPLNLTTTLEAQPYLESLDTALAEALVNRTEIAALAKEELLDDESIITAKAGWKPSVQAFAGYEVTSRVQTRTAGEELHGGLIGAQASWAIFDGFLTKGKVDQAVALRAKAGEAKAETTRIVELQVRTAWSDLRTARAVLVAQAKNVAKAVRALELAETRYNEGAGTQIDVLNAQTALTEARGLLVSGLQNYSIARAGMLRATGSDMITNSR